MDASSVTRILHTRFALTVAFIIAAVGAGLSYYLSDGIGTSGSEGFVSGWSVSSVVFSRPAGTAIAALLNIVIVALMLNINKTHNLLRAMTRLHAAMFLVFELAVPWLLYTPVPGLLLCIVVLWCINLLYTLYGQELCDTRKVFIAFFMLSACSSFDYSYIVYMPVMVLATLQLQIFSLRSSIAILLGLVTPWILFLGSGLVSVSQLQLPLDGFGWPPFGSASMLVLGGIVAFTAFVAICSWLQNVVKIITYNAKSRQMLSVISILTLVTVLASLIDMSHIYCFIVMLNCCAAFQIALLFTAILNFPKSYIGVLTIVLIYLIMYVWNLLV